MVSLEVVAILLSGLSISASLIYYTNVLQSQNKTRQTQIFMELHNKFRSKEFMRETYELYQMEWNDINDFFQRYDSSVDIDNFEKRYHYWFYFDGVGMLLKRGLIDLEMLHYLMGGYGALWMWEKFGEIIKESRIRLNAPDHLVMFEYLVEEMKKMRTKRNHSLEVPEHWGDFTAKL